MASRTISTRLAIEGESEYRSAIANINNSLKTLKSELGLVASQYQGNANSMEALRAKSEVLARTEEAQQAKVEQTSAALQNAQKAQQAYSYQVEQSSAKLAGAKAKLEELKKSTSDTSAQQQKLTAEVAKHQKALEDAQAGYNAATKGVNDWQRSNNNAQRDLNNLDAEIQRNNKYMDEAAHSANGCASSIDEYGREVRDADRDTGGMSEALGALSSVLAAAGVAASLKEIAEALKACIDASVEFESAMAGVRRTVGGTDEEIAAFKKEFQDMSLEIPTTTTELGKIAETAGQLGIAKEYVSVFTRVMAMLATTTDLTAENAATMLAQFANITGLTEYERLGAVVASLGDATATTASKVVEMSQGIAAAGSIAGMRETDILAIAAAVGSLGIEAQAGSTAMSTLISDMSKSVEMGGEKLSKFASVAGLSAEEFAAAWRKDAVGALDAFIKGLNDTERNGKSAVVLLDELGITNVRQTKAILGLSNAGDLLTGTIAQANQAWGENTALTEKAGIMYATTESKVALAKNAFNNLKVAIGDELTPAMGALAEVGEGAFTWAEEFVRQHPGLVQAIAGVTVAIGTLLVGLTGFMLVQKLLPLIKAFQVALVGLSGAAIALPIIGVVSALAGLVVVLTTSAAKTDEATAKTRELTKSIRENAETYSTATDKIRGEEQNTLAMISALESLVDQENKTTAQKDAILSLVDKLNEAVPTLSLAYNENTDSLVNMADGAQLTADALIKMAEAAADEAERAAAVDALTDALVRQKELKAELADAEAELAEAQAINNAAVADSIGQYGGVGPALQSWNTEVTTGGMRVAELTAAQQENEKQIAELKDRCGDLTRAERANTAAVEENTDANEENESQYQSLNAVLTNVQGGYDLLTKAQKEMTDSGYLSISTVSTLLEKYPELSRYLVEVEGGYKLADGALEDYIATQRAEYQIALNDAQAAANAIVSAEAGKINAINATTLAAKDQLRALAALYKSMGANADNMAEGGSYFELARQYQAAADQLEDAGKSLESFDRITATLGRSSGSKKSSGKKSAAKEKTGAELDLEAYQAAVKELDHLRAMEQVSEEDYYRRKAALGETYLKDNQEQRRKLDEELYAWQKGAYERELTALREALEAEKLTREEYFASLQALQDKYFQEGTEAWKSAEEQRRQEVRRVNQAAYDQELSDNKYFKDMGLISEEEYYARLSALRDKYLEENSEEWRRANVELHSYLEQRRQEELRAAEEAYNAQADALKKALDERLAAAKDAYSDELDALKQAYGDQKDAAKQAYSEKKAQIQAELDLEKKRLNAVIDGIDAEIQARRELREDEDQDDAIAKARKKLEAAEAEVAYARTPEDAEELKKEAQRLREALEKAIQDKEDTAFYREKEAEKEAVKEQVTAAEEKAKGEQSAAQSAYDEQLGRLEGDYNASVAQIQADYEAAVRRLEAEYGAALDRLERREEKQGGSALDPEVLAIARANNVSYSDARDMRDANRRNEGSPDAPHYSDGGYGERAASTGQALAGILGAVASAGTSVLGGAISHVVNNSSRSASVTVNSGGTPTEGQLARTVEKVLSKLGR